MMLFYVRYASKTSLTHNLNYNVFKRVMILML